MALLSDPLAARAKEIVAMRTLVVLMDPVMSRFAAGVDRSMADRQ
jgi:hypothetical protein